MTRKTQTNGSAHQAEARQSGTRTIDPAKHHVGRTLESDPEYNEQPGRELAPQAGLIDPHGNDLTASPDLRDATQRVRDEYGPQEPLKTRLPGDTSSDPHTDFGADNATVVQHRGETKPKRKTRA
jgi:hypothetical protein